MTRRAWAGVVLAASISGTPYLDRHADDAVLWRAWSDSTLGEARSANRLIFVSVGFFACHGCHVMEQESFENARVAATLNERTIPVLIDRDDRPDLDARFAGDLRRVGVEPGWPMTLWLLPDGRAISAATYLSPEEVVERTRRLADLWARDPGRLVSVAAATDAAHAADTADSAGIPAVVGASPPSASGRWTPSLLHELVAAAAREGDPRHGGLRGAPKFPRDLPVAALLEKAAGPAPRAQAIATLRAILASPLHDPVDGGFHRYSTDESWRSPHWEKLLDENALLALDLLAAWRATGDDEFRRACLRTLDFVSSRLGLGSGRFAQALDSDGPFYQLAPAERATAPRPRRDESVILAPNAHAARAFARAGFWLGRPEYVAIARSTLDTLLAARGAGGTGAVGGLPHALRARSGSAPSTPTTPTIPATLADHAALALAALEVFQVSGEIRWLEVARALDTEIAERFLTAAGEALEFAVESPAPLSSQALEILPDRPVPSGAALALELAARLSVLDPPIGSRRIEHARRLFARLAPDVSREPLSHADALLAGAILEQPVEIVLAVRAREDARPWVEVAARHAPWRAIVLVLDDATRRDLERATPLAGGKTPNGAKPRGFVCKGSVCDLPAIDIETFRSQLDALP